MVKEYEVFWFGSTGPSWIDVADSLNNAKKITEKSFAADSSGYAVLLDRQDGNCSTMGSDGFAADGVTIFP